MNFIGLTKTFIKSNNLSGTLETLEIIRNTPETLLTDLYIAYIHYSDKSQGEETK